MTASAPLGPTAKEFLRQQKKLPSGLGMSMRALAEASGVAYSTVYRHVHYNAPVDARTARRLRKGSGGVISAIRLLGLNQEPLAELVEEEEADAAPTIRYRDNVARYFLDTEFMEDGRTIELLSIAVVADDGREYYAADRDADQSRANDWVRAHVLPRLPPSGSDAWKSRAQIRDELARFFATGELPEIWASYASYDWVALCQLFGRMVDLPVFMPKYCMDLKQLAVLTGNASRPPKNKHEHDALHDARWSRDLFNLLRGRRSP